MIYSKQTALHHYSWGGNCEGWEYIESQSLSVKEERMPPGTSEKTHFHKTAQQFFFILKGEASIEIEGELFTVKAKEGIHILNGQKHRILNKGMEDLEFLLTSTPSSKGDRYEPGENS
jgi:mannose-6-phosphate isomerase-like protein (cupin superfamily)